MNKYVENYKTYEYLDALRLRGTLDGLSVKELWELLPKVPCGHIGSIIFGKYKLCIEHYGETEGINLRYSDREMLELIKNDINKAFLVSIHKYDDYVYVLNIAYEDYFGPSGNKPSGAECSPKLLNKHLAPYMPIIQKFMVDALTDNLYIIEDGKLVKQ